MQDLIADDCSIIATKWQNKTVDLILDKVVGAKYWDTFFGTKWDLTPIVEGQFSLVIKIRVFSWEPAL